ncbi:MAG TPA: hypothetical protein VFB08_19140 [Burkholderiales bacterium]|nr:hypothetical protein [Burkholderiales bacterium]
MSDTKEHPAARGSRLDFGLYCPRCRERIHREPLSVDMDEMVACGSCFVPSRAADLLTDQRGRTFLDHLVWLSQSARSEA